MKFVPNGSIVKFLLIAALGCGLAFLVAWLTTMFTVIKLTQGVSLAGVALILLWCVVIGGAAVWSICAFCTLYVDVIYLQAKRYSPDSSIGPDKIREFAGAMDAHGITKGVFVTTSRYTKAALEYAERSHKRLRLIDGNELARLMVQHGIGVREYRVLELERFNFEKGETRGGGTAPPGPK